MNQIKTGCKQFVREAFQHYKTIAAVGDDVRLLTSAGAVQAAGEKAESKRGEDAHQKWAYRTGSPARRPRCLERKTHVQVTRRVNEVGVCISQITEKLNMNQSITSQQVGRFLQK